MALLNARDDVSDRAAPILRQAQDEDFGHVTTKNAPTLRQAQDEDFGHVTTKNAPTLRQAQDEDFGRAATENTLSLSKGEDKVPSLGDLRFRALLSAEDWAALPEPVRARFSKRLKGGDSVVYAGAVTQTRITRAGKLFCQLARLIGGPLPLFDDVGIPAIVTVTEDGPSGGQVWTRVYARRNGFPQVIHSAKRFAGETGLEEVVGHGVGMALRVSVEDGALLFRSTRYFVQLGAWRLRLPRALVPGALTVTHRELGEGRFLFALDVVHPLFGPFIHQSAIFKDASP